MKKNVLTFGLIAGLIVTIVMVTTSLMLYTANYECNMYVGYASMIIAFSMIFVAVKNYRDKYNGGMVSFGKALLIGLYVTLIASTVYVVAWLIDYHFFVPDFMDKYAEHVIQATKTSGASAQEVAKQVKEMGAYKEMYKNPVFIILLTYMEILPVGLVITLITALILKRNPDKTVLAAN
ncbi:Protein of unknown function [Mucilaginibacter pineti]|uniref:DUF4199 domain-containing protein n=1 Tax=Mucilaginibacter pineti TaxID=1391627 RepID=A0A1G6TRI8_9SPHI|nr:DUF4199 domain-containing protein [Mucilaginibacter pineti]SDD31651.1 Protein of unknown function [Mucilaginibacter pineti]